MKAIIVMEKRSQYTSMSINDFSSAYEFIQDVSSSDIKAFLKVKNKK